MLKRNGEKLSRKALGLFCAIVLLVCALYVPMAVSVSAAEPLPVKAGETVTFGFEDTFGTSTDPINKAEFDATGVGFNGWSTSVSTATDDASNKVIVTQRTQNETWATLGGLRLNKKVGSEYQVYNLEKNTRYFVTLKVRVVSSSVFTDDAKTPHECYVSMGYGAKKTGTDGNYLNAMDKTLVRVVSSKAGSGVYTLATDTKGTTESFDCGNEWQTVTYEFTTPADFGGVDPALAFYGNARTGFRVEIDDLSITKLDANTGIIVFVDEYSGKTETVFGTVGSAVSLPDVSDRAQQSDHIFEGWFTDVDRTVKAENVKFTASEQKIYTRWKAPVTVTFVDKLNGTEQQVTGMAGDKFSYPADPVNPANTSWFMGWYTDEGYTTEHVSGKFGYGNMSLYACFKGEIPGLKQDFEAYPHGKKEVHDAVDTATGVTYKKYKDNLIIGNTMTLQSDVTASNDSKTAVKFVWDSTMKRDFAAGIGVNDPNSYNAATRYHEFDNYIWLGSGIEDKQDYIITFKVKVEKAETNLEFYALSAAANNGWGNYVRYQPGYKSYAVSDEWQTVSFQIKTNFKSATSNTMYLGVHMSENKDVVLYFDDVEIKAVAQPYESIVIINNGYDDAPVNLKGKRGEEIELPALTHPNGAPFLGWYMDEAYEEEISITTYPRGAVTVYAKWGTAPIKFNETYTWNTDGTSFGKNTVSIEEGNGVGYDDDYALKFTFKGNDIYNETTGVLMNTRYNQRDHVAAVAKGIKSGSLYHVSYYYKASDSSNVAARVRIGTGYGPNVWVNDCWNEYAGFAKEIPVGDEGWTKADFYFVPEVKTSGSMVGNTLYFLFGVANDNKDNFAELYVDNVLVEEITGDYIYFHGNASAAPDTVVAGKAGDSFTMPNPSFGTSELLGYFLDENCNIPFTATTIPEGVTHVYASWKLGAITFKNDYPYSTSDNLRFGKLFSIVRENGIGYDDNYAIRWDFVGSEKYNDTALWASRASQYDSVFTVATDLKDGAIYRVSYKYMATSKTNVDVSITPTSCGAANIWWNDVRYVYDDAMVTIPAGGTDGWQSAEVYISANVLKTQSLTGDALFLLFRLSSGDVTNVADVRIDNVKVERITAPYAFFDCQNGKDSYMIQGKVGEKITYPANPTRFGHTFKGWYKDRECTEKFTLDTFAIDTEVTAYAGWTAASEVTYTFEEYDVYNGYKGKSFFIGDAVVDGKKPRNGKKALHFGNRSEGNYNNGGSYAAIAHGTESCNLELGYMYVVNVNYCVNSAPSGSMNLRFVGSLEGHYWAGKNNTTFVSDEMTITSGEITSNGGNGKWLNKTFVVDTAVLKEKGHETYTYLFLQVTGAKDWDVCFDDITVTRVPKGQSAVCIDNQGCSKIPTVILGKPGASFASKLPEKPEYNDMYFKGYYTKDAQGAYNEMKREDMKFGETAITLYARFLNYEVTEGFDTDYLSKGESFAQSYTTYDFDYEIYDATKDGNSKDNVVSGNNSLHRKGNSMYFENAVILTLGNQIAEGERYTVSFKVKMGDYKQIDGAIKIVSGRSFRYAWTTTGEYYPVIAIEDLTDGQWHEVSYTFNSVEAFACIQTPGYVELFMDDFKFTLAGDETPLSNPIKYTEYVPAKRDADGKLVEIEKGAVDVTSIIDISLYVDNSAWIWVAVAAAAVLIIGGGVLAFILIKKKKQGKA